MSSEPSEVLPQESSEETSSPTNGDSVAAEAPLSKLRKQLAARQADAARAPAATEVSPPEQSSETAHHKYPPPNLRDRLSPDLEQEYESALGDGDIEALMDGSTTETAAAELAPGTRVSAKVVKVHGDDVFVEFGGRGQGTAPLKQFQNEPQPEQMFELVVARHLADEGLYELNLPTAAVDVGNWDDVAEGQIVEATITGSNKGGLECQVASLRGFVPMGQISIYHVQNPEECVGQRMACVVLEANRERRNLVLSHRAMMERERQEKRESLLADLAPGQIREGVVRNLRDFGAFVDLGGIDGLVHISKLSWDRVNHPSEVLQEGQAIKVKVEKVDRESGKIALSYREVGANPWDKVDENYPVGSTVTGAISKLMDFGAFVKLAPGVEGLIHISELAHGRVARTGDVVQQGQEVEVKVLTVDREKQRIGLSLRAMTKKPEVEETADGDASPERERRRRRQPSNLKGGLGGDSGGEHFGLKW